MHPDICGKNLSKVYEDGHQALKNINLEINKGEIFALLGPNGAGKTTLISIICGIVNLSEGKVEAAGHDIIRDYRQARASIGLVPQELNTDSFETCRLYTSDAAAERPSVDLGGRRIINNKRFNQDRCGRHNIHVVN